MTPVIDKGEKRLTSISIATYMDDPSDIMNLTVQFGRIPDGPNHVGSATIESVRKELPSVPRTDDTASA
jgi:hypothetical protein